jgi:DDE superfamily endonuclease
MMRTKARWAPPLHQDVSVVRGGPASRDAMARRLRPSCKRSEPRQRAMADRRGWLSPAERTNRWPRADVTGDATPYAFQHRRRRAPWAPEAVRDERRHALVPHLGAPEAVRVLDETGLLTNGRHAAGGARPYRGTAGTVEHGQIGRGLGSAGQLGQAVRLARCLGPRRGPPIAPAAGRRASRTRAAW